ncbi:hypothetical protein D6D19_01304 [Aureobasidium pullulans]|uniref:Uncharacterized protein n=1 Tax=Aureobasidium pullulans TaxID=5580 RepID=A0A4V4ISW6_AURPU|nr:hypothetical protein D6D19_01304 [Aureobasidium pullulans]THY27516.1 hypothetical protein D6D00_04827 [Aureobasidium pullulans]
MAHKLDSTAVTPQGATFPLYRVNTDVCDYNAYTDDTGCSCIIYTDTFDDVNTICQTSSAQTAYYWTDRTNCIVKTIKGESVDRIDKGRSVDSMTGSQYCSGVFDSNAQVLESVLSMPVGPDVNLVASTPSSSSWSASRAASSSSSVASSSSDSSSSGDSSSNSPSGSWTTTSFTGPCECQQYLCYTTGGCDEAIPHTFSGADSCTAGSTSVSKSDVQTGHEQWNLVCFVSRLFPRLFPRSICFRSGWSFSSERFHCRGLVNPEQSYTINVNNRWLFSFNWTVNDSYTQWADK